jgi:hypothetical protein
MLTKTGTSGFWAHNCQKNGREKTADQTLLQLR